MAGNQLQGVELGAAVGEDSRRDCRHRLDRVDDRLLATEVPDGE